ncbi:MULTISPECIES: GH92 family glycosyl hydrolase [Arsenicicoccus]|uniref:GH92 family glycosyl hydrolase n=1 Tax=Arsenicicoccus TaxID=267408 RepID=UPI00257C16CD|nr:MULTISPECIES: GH92 family glycosyl hydrolase [Arsenicicoccus]
MRRLVPLAAASTLVLAVTSSATSAAGAPVDPATPLVSRPQVAKDLSRYVDPLVGTSNGGNTYPGAVRPFGMLSWSPTSTAGDQTSTAASNGYSHDTTKLRGFSLTHVNGAGCHPGAMGDVPIFPHPAAMGISPSADTKDEVYASTFSHAGERAVPGRYTLALDNGVRIDAAATTRAAVTSLGFPAGKPANLLFRTSNSLNGSESAEISIDPATRTVTGSVLTGAFCGRRATGNGSNKRSYYRLHFVASFDRAFTGTGTWVNDRIRPGTRRAIGGEGYETGAARAGKGSGGWVSFAPGTTVGMKVGISYTSLGAARANLAAEVAPRDTVASVARAADQQWDEQLTRVQVAGGSTESRTKLYTALYHAFLEPNVVNDVAGTYWGADQRVHRLSPGQRAQLGNFSGWDEYRAHTQLLALLEPRLAGDFAQSLLNNSRHHGGVWDRWVHLTAWTHVMTGDPSAPTLAGFYSLGVRNFETRAAFASLYRQATVPHADGLSTYGCPGQCAGIRPDLAQYLALGYVPQDGGHSWGGAAETLEDSVADYALADWAARLGRTSEADAMRRRASSWKNTFNPVATPDGGYQQARNADGSWVQPFTPASDKGFAQGSSATYTWMVPHDVSGLSRAMGGDARAISRLDAFFRKPDGSWVTGGDPLRYDATNEPGIHTPWLYNALGAPWKTQEAVRAMERLAYTTGPKGLPGNDDLGTMSSWYVFAALGIYPQNPARAEMLLSSPVFPRAWIRRDGGATIRIDAPAASPDHVYIDRVRVNGRPWTRSWLTEGVVNDGGVVRIDLRRTPNTRWATMPGDRPVDR